MWRNLIIIDRLISSVNEELSAKEEDKLILSWEERRWMRGRFTTIKGRKIGIALPTGTTPAPGSILWIGPDWYLKMEAAPEAVLEISPPNYDSAVKIAFEIGNRHYPLGMRDGKLLVPDDAAMVRLMDRLGVPWQPTQTVFDPIGSTQFPQHG